MSSRLARQSLDLLSLSPSKKTNQSALGESSKKKEKIKLPKINKGIKKVKHEIRYGRHKKTKLLQEEIKKRENPIGNIVYWEKEKEASVTKDCYTQIY
jgi:hypothetical protein